MDIFENFRTSIGTIRSGISERGRGMATVISKHATTLYVNHAGSNAPQSTALPVPRTLAIKVAVFGIVLLVFALIVPLYGNHSPHQLSFPNVVLAPLLPSIGSNQSQTGNQTAAPSTRPSIPQPPRLFPSHQSLTECLTAASTIPQPPRLFPPTQSHTASQSHPQTISQSQSTTQFPAKIDGLSCVVGLSEHVPGRWVDTITTQVRDHPPCCGWDSDKGGNNIDPLKQQCGSKDKLSEWAGTSQYLQAAGGKSCTTTCRTAEHIRWKWVPHAPCSLDTWSAARFCENLGTRRLLMIGDSVGEQIAAAVHNYVVWGGGTCAGQLFFGHSDTLTGRLYGHMGRGGSWSRYLDSVRPDIVIVNAGAHVSKREQLMEVMEDVFAEFTALTAPGGGYPGLKLVWRTHTGAGKGTGSAPLSGMPAELGLWKAYKKGDGYQWEEMEQWDNVALDFWRARNVSVLDLRPLWMRLDAHSDGMHFCLPGPLLMAVQVLSTLLAELR
jgi:hypothetical protein